MDKEDKNEKMDSLNPETRKGPQKDEHVNQYGEKNDKIDKEDLEEDN